MSTLKLEDTLLVSTLVKALLLTYTMSILGCSMPDQMSSSTQSSSGSSMPSAGAGMPGTESSSMPTSSGSGMPGDQDFSFPKGDESGDSVAEAGDVQGGNGEDIGNEALDTLGDDSETEGSDAGAPKSADSELDQSLSEFDDLFEGGTYSSNVDILIPPGTYAAPTSSDEPLFEELDSSAAIEEASDSSPESASQIDESSQPESGEMITESSGPQPIPDDVGDGRGDNVIERQIRQAAELETDPVLREQLWDEYRRMKGQKE